MKKKTEIILEFFEDRFGPLLSETLLTQYFKRFNVISFDKMDLKLQIETGQKIIEDIYKDFYNPEKIRNFRILFLLRFSLNEAIGKIEKMINTTSKIQIEPLSDVDVIAVDTVLDVIKDDSSAKFGFECSNLLDGLLMMTLETNSAISLADKLMKVMLGAEPENNKLDDIKISAVYEFFNILLPGFLEVIGDAYGTPIYFTPLYYNDFQSKYFYAGEFMTPQKIMKSVINIEIGKTKSSWDVFFFIKQADDNFSELVEQTKSKANDPFEQNPPKILIERTGSRRFDLEKFFKMLNLRSADIDFVITKIGASSVENLNIIGKNNFTSMLIKSFFAIASDRKKETIRRNIDNIFGFNKSA